MKKLLMKKLKSKDVKTMWHIKTEAGMAMHT